MALGSRHQAILQPHKKGESRIHRNRIEIEIEVESIHSFSTENPAKTLARGTTTKEPRIDIESNRIHSYAFARSRRKPRRRLGEAILI